MVKVRFHLGRGPNFMHWQVTSPDGVQYYHPEEVVLRMKNCRLRNQSGTARKIFTGEDKTVCAWIDCLSVEVEPVKPSDVIDVDYVQVSYNPRIAPHWRNRSGENIDGHKLGEIVSSGRYLYALDNAELINA